MILTKKIIFFQLHIMNNQYINYENLFHIKNINTDDRKKK
jgi:hypothetical protein